MNEHSHCCDDVAILDIFTDRKCLFVLPTIISISFSTANDLNEVIKTFKLRSTASIKLYFTDSLFLKTDSYKQFLRFIREIRIFQTTNFKIYIYIRNTEREHLFKFVLCLISPLLTNKNISYVTCVNRMFKHHVFVYLQLYYQKHVSISKYYEGKHFLHTVELP